MKYTALALDLDGTTLVGEDLPPANKAALQRARDAGLEVIIATARWIEMAQRIAEEVGLNGLAIACSGAQVRNLQTNADIFDHRLPINFVQDLYDICNADRCIATVTVSERVLLKLDGQPDADVMGPEMDWVPQLQVDTANLPRIGAIQGSKVCQRIKQELGPKYRDSVNIFDSIGPTGKLVITLTAKSADKGAALHAACDHLSLDTEKVVAFGDAENDLAMFKVAGLSVAMGQADNAVKQAADRTTTPNDEDGVARAIDQLFADGLIG